MQLLRGSAAQVAHPAAPAWAADTAKVKLQLQPKSATPKYRGLLGTCLTVAREEGASKLWAGLAPGGRQLHWSAVRPSRVARWFVEQRLGRRYAFGRAWRQVGGSCTGLLLGLVVLLDGLWSNAWGAAMLLGGPGARWEAAALGATGSALARLLSGGALHSCWHTPRSCTCDRACMQPHLPSAARLLPPND